MPLTSPEAAANSTQIHNLEVMVHGLSARINELEQRPPSPVVELDKLIDLQHEVQCFTEDLFGSPASLQPWRDEETDERHFIVHATAKKGDAAEVLRLNELWHRRIHEIAGNL